MQYGTVEWTAFCPRLDKWIPYQPAESSKIEKAFVARKQWVNITVNTKTSVIPFQIDFQNMLQVGATGKTRTVYRAMGGTTPPAPYLLNRTPIGGTLAGPTKKHTSHAGALQQNYSGHHQGHQTHQGQGSHHQKPLPINPQWRGSTTGSSSGSTTSVPNLSGLPPIQDVPPAAPSTKPLLSPLPDTTPTPPSAGQSHDPMTHRATQGHQKQQQPNYSSQGDMHTQGGHHGPNYPGRTTPGSGGHQFVSPPDPNPPSTHPVPDLRFAPKTLSSTDSTVPGISSAPNLGGLPPIQDHEAGTQPPRPTSPKADTGPQHRDPIVIETGPPAQKPKEVASNDDAVGEQSVISPKEQGVEDVTVWDMPMWTQVAPEFAANPNRTNAESWGEKNTFTALDLMRQREIDPELNSKLSIWHGDITRLKVDAIVNAASTTLMGGGGIDGIIHTAAGDALRLACQQLGGAQVGETKLTEGFRLPARAILHTVGPIGGGDEELASCYKTSLALCLQHNLRTVAFCSVSTGVYGFPLVRATHIALRVVRDWMDVNRSRIDRVVFCVYKDEQLECYEKLAPSYFPIKNFPAEALPKDTQVLEPRHPVSPPLQQQDPSVKDPPEKSLGGVPPMQANNAGSERQFADTKDQHETPDDILPSQHETYAVAVAGGGGQEIAGGTRPPGAFSQQDTHGSALDDLPPIRDNEGGTQPPIVPGGQFSTAQDQHDPSDYPVPPLHPEVALLGSGTRVPESPVMPLSGTPPQQDTHHGSALGDLPPIEDYKTSTEPPRLASSEPHGGTITRTGDEGQLELEARVAAMRERVAILQAEVDLSERQIRDTLELQGALV